MLGSGEVMVTPTICLPSINFFLAVLYIRTGPLAFLQSCCARATQASVNPSITQTAPATTVRFISPPRLKLYQILAVGRIGGRRREFGGRSSFGTRERNDQLARQK